MSLKWLDTLEERIIIFLIAAGTIIVFLSVLHRYLSGVPMGAFQDFIIGINFSWAQELCIYMLVWMAKFGAAYGVRTGIHVGVDVLINRMNPQTRSKFIVLGLLAGALFTAIVATLGAHFVWENGAHYSIFQWLGKSVDGIPEGPTTPDLEWPTWMVYSAIPLGTSLMCFRFLQVTWSFLRTGELPHHDHGHVDGLEEINPYAMQDNLHPAK